jgi:hypothetical protein
VFAPRVDETMVFIEMVFQTIGELFSGEMLMKLFRKRKSERPPKKRLSGVKSLDERK